MNRGRFKSVKEFALLQDIDASGLAEIERAAHRRVAEKGRILYLPGDVPEAIYFLASGSVKVSHLSESGKEFILYILEPGQFFGEGGVLDGTQRETVAEALEKVTLWLVPAQRFRAVLGKRPELLLRLVQAMALRQKQLERRLLDIVYKNAPQRLADLLLELSKSHGIRDARGTLLRIRLSQSALGNLLGVSREIVNHTFSELKRRGIIEIAEGRVVIQNAKALQELAA